MDKLLGVALNFRELNSILKSHCAELHVVAWAVCVTPQAFSSMYIDSLTIVMLIVRACDHRVNGPFQCTLRCCVCHIIVMTLFNVIITAKIDCMI